MRNAQYILGLDIGTSSIKAMLCSISGKIECVSSERYQIVYPGPDMVEQEPEEVFNAVIKLVRSIADYTGVPPSSLSALVFGGILHSLIPVDSEGQALSRAIIWGDSRSTGESEQLRRELDAEEVKARTGCTIHPLYFLPRLLWLKKNAGDILKRAEKIISIKEYILRRLYGEHVVDRSTASGTGIWNMSTMDWDSELLKIARVPRVMFSRVVEPAYILKGLKKEYASEMGILPGTPAVIGASDGLLAHLGSTGLRNGVMSLTVGTSGAIRQSLQTPAVLPGKEAWCYYLAEGRWVQGAVTHDAGIVMNWFFKKILEGASCGSSDESMNYQELNRWADGVNPGAEGLLFFPVLGGERSPHYNPSARGAVVGLSFIHGKEHLVRALMEGISYRLYSNYRMLVNEGEMELVATGGILGSPAWLKITADYFGKRLWLPAVHEASAWGAILIGMKALGLIENLDDSQKYTGLSGCVEPDPKNHLLYKEVNRRYEDIYRKLFQ